MRRFMRLKTAVCAIGVVCVGLGSVSTALAVPVFGKIMEIKQPDGALVQVRIWGDEFYRVVESLDGYTLVRDPQTKVICYAELSEDGDELVSTGIRAQEVAPANLTVPQGVQINSTAMQAKIAAVRGPWEQDMAATKAAAIPSIRSSFSQKPPPVVRTRMGIVLLFNFPDDPPPDDPNHYYEPSPDEVDDFFNLPGYSGDDNNGSVFDYFYDVSDGKMNYGNYVVTAYHQASQNREYYQDETVPMGIRAQELIREAIDELDDGGFDFSLYDLNNDDIVDAINCFYTGPRPTWGYGLWPHMSVLQDGAGHLVRKDGKYMLYQISDIDTALRIGTVCHENGHMLMFWPDLYDYGDSCKESQGVGNFCLMAGGSYGGPPLKEGTNPVRPCAFLRYISGWTTTNVLTTPQTGLVVPAESNTIYQYNNPLVSEEYFLLENRQKTERDTYLPAAGLAIWHIDERSIDGFQANEHQEQGSEANQHYGVTLVQADNQWHLEHRFPPDGNGNAGDPNDFWSGPAKDRFVPKPPNPDTTPNSHWWDKSDSLFYATQISPSGNSMTFRFTKGIVDCNGNDIDDLDDIDNHTSLDCNGNDIPDECDIASGVARDNDHDGLISDCDNCVNIPNGPALGTCLGGLVGHTCHNNAECNSSPSASDGDCDKNQRETSGDGAGDACECTAQNYQQVCKSVASCQVLVGCNQNLGGDGCDYDPAPSFTCDDHKSCTQNLCSPDDTNDLSGCVYPADPASTCDDGKACTGVETCNPSAAGSNPTTGCVTTGNPCDEPDMFACAEDSGSPDGYVCYNCMTDADCDDGMWCNGQEKCVDYQCQDAMMYPCPSGTVCSDIQDKCLTPGSDGRTDEDPLLDTDGDGVKDKYDKCPDTMLGDRPVDTNGCSAGQRDDDVDGVANRYDECPGTPLLEEVDANGCSAQQLNPDDDGDGVLDAADKCPDTPKKETADKNGCSCSQRDTDGDGIDDCKDNCPNKKNADQKDSDKDGIGDACDTNEPPTPAADLSVVLTSDAEESVIVPDVPTTVTIRAQNDGETDVEGVTIEVTFPLDVEVISSDSLNKSGETTTSISWSSLTLASGTTVERTFTIQLAAGSTAESVALEASVTFDGEDSDPTNDQSTLTLTVGNGTEPPQPNPDNQNGNVSGNVNGNTNHNDNSSGGNLNGNTGGHTKDSGGLCGMGMSASLAFMLVGLALMKGRRRF